MTIVSEQATAPFDLDQTEAFWLAPGRLFDGEAVQVGRALRIANGRVAEIVSASDAGRDGLPVWRTECLASPGFFDVQINGGGGVLFNANPTVEGLRAIAAAHRASGTTALLPTLITDAPEVMDRAVEAVLEAYGRDGIVGVHLEGPHVSIARKGAHNPRFIRPIDEHTFAAARRLRTAGVPVLLTLAPECVPPGTIATLSALGVVVSLGHTAADAAITRAAIAEGARCVTHLYNAMTPITSREPGVVGAALDSEIYCGFIADGHHVDDAVLRLAIRSRPVSDRMVLVSDAMPTWRGPDSYTLYGETIRLDGGRLINAIGSLAGVHIDMAASLRRLVAEIGIPLDAALRMATANPSRLMGLEQSVGFLKPGFVADITLLGL
jgi:N-acetylglucosamine-6-phosphate deacetylase